MDALVLSQVLDVVAALSAGDVGHEAAVRAAWQAQQGVAGVPAPTPDASALEHGAREARQRWADAATQLVDGAIDRQEYTRLREAAQADLQAASSVARASGHPAEALPDLPAMRHAVVTWGPALAGDDMAAQRSILMQLVARVVPVRLGQARYGARIGWTRLGEALRSCAAAVPGRTAPTLRGYPNVVLFRSGSGPRATLSATSRRHRTRNLDQLRALPQAAVDALPERDRALVELYCGRTDGEPHSRDELGKRFGVGRCRVGQILRRSMVHLQ
jgi:Sigma-70, region 4